MHPLDFYFSRPEELTALYPSVEAGDTEFIGVLYRELPTETEWRPAFVHPKSSWAGHLYNVVNIENHWHGSHIDFHWEGVPFSSSNINDQLLKILLEGLHRDSAFRQYLLHNLSSEYLSRHSIDEAVTTIFRSGLLTAHCVYEFYNWSQEGK